MLDTEVGEDTVKNVRCELGDDLHTDTDTDRIADWGIEDVLNIFKRTERNLGKRDERTEKIEFRDDTQITEECFKCLKMCEEAERKNPGGIVECLRKMIKNSRISINTVDGIQGDEKDVILLCTTKAAKYGDQICSDFIKNPKRINVALSRAHSGLFIFGDITYLENSSEWKYIVHHFKVRKAIIKPGNIKKMFVVRK
uniref:AAA_12 domain-containing protein n=1 Tax=Rhabditophanes sp. KR3021 TaxID=114890 RepID=A0AC35TW10_9BILA